MRHLKSYCLGRLLLGGILLHQPYICPISGITSPRCWPCHHSNDCSNQWRKIVGGENIGKN